MEADNRKTEFLPYKIVCERGYGEYEEKSHASLQRSCRLRQ